MNVDNVDNVESTWRIKLCATAKNGEISYIEYVNAIEETIDVLMKHADAINEYNQAVIAIQRLTGIM